MAVRSQLDAMNFRIPSGICGGAVKTTTLTRHYQQAVLFTELQIFLLRGVAEHTISQGAEFSRGPLAKT